MYPDNPRKRGLTPFSFPRPSLHAWAPPVKAAAELLNPAALCAAQQE